MKRLFLHIGQPKTATTSIQNFLAVNREQLIKKGWLYPNAARQYAAHHLLGNFFRAQPIHWIGSADPSAVMQELMHEIEETGCDNIIMSTESLYFAENHARFRDYFKAFDVSVVVFLRRQDEWLESAYQENLKNGETRLDPERYLAAHAGSLDYAARLKTWADVFGKEKILVHSFESTAEKQPIEKICMDLMGAPFTADLTMPPAKNERLNRDCTTFLTMFHASPRVDMKHQVIKDLLIKYSQAHPDPAELRYAYHPLRRREIVESRAEMNAIVAREYLGREDGVLFRNPLPDGDTPWQPYPGLRVRTSVSISEFLCNALYKMGERAGRG